MTEPTTDPYAQALGKRMSAIRESGSVRAALRRGALDLEDLTVNPYVYQGFPENLRGNGYPSPAELAFRDTVCLYASLASGGRDVHTPGAGNLGRTLQRVALNKNNLPSQDSHTKRMHNALVTANTRESVLRAVTDVSRSAVRQGAPLDFFALVYDLRRMYTSPVQARATAARWSSSYSYVKESA